MNLFQKITIVLKSGQKLNKKNLTYKERELICRRVLDLHKHDTWTKEMITDQLNRMVNHLDKTKKKHKQALKIVVRAHNFLISSTHIEKEDEKRKIRGLSWIQGPSEPIYRPGAREQAVGSTTIPTQRPAGRERGPNIPSSLIFKPTEKRPNEV